MGFLSLQRFSSAPSHAEATFKVACPELESASVCVDLVSQFYLVNGMRFNISMLIWASMRIRIRTLCEILMLPGRCVARFAAGGDMLQLPRGNSYCCRLCVERIAQPASILEVVELSRVRLSNQRYGRSIAQSHSLFSLYQCTSLVKLRLCCIVVGMRWKRPKTGFSPVPVSYCVITEVDCFMMWSVLQSARRAG